MYETQQKQKQKQKQKKKVQNTLICTVIHPTYVTIYPQWGQKTNNVKWGYSITTNKLCSFLTIQN